jgi:predicted XRE-type DNA-binding protein
VEQLLTMSTRELTRLELMQRLQQKRLSQNEAVAQLGISTRQVKQLWKAYQSQGAAGLISQRQGKPSNNQIDRRVLQ